MTVLRITFCILTCVCVAAAVPVGIFFEWWCLVPIAAAVVFGVLMLMAKNSAAPADKGPHADFMNTDEENEKLRRPDDDKRETK